MRSSLFEATQTTYIIVLHKPFTSVVLLSEFFKPIKYLN